MKKILHFFLILFILELFYFFLFSSKSYYFPKIIFDFKDYNNIEDFQVIVEGKHYYNKSKTKLEPEFLYSFSYLPIGYVKFKKLGDTVEFFLPNHHSFWIKKSFSYAYMEPEGKYIFFINSDRSKIEVFDKNGNLIIEENGNFLVDLHCYDIRNIKKLESSVCFILFSDGKLVAFSKDIYKKMHLGNQGAFYKSLSMLDDKLHIHFFQNHKDHFSVYTLDIKRNENKEFVLKHKNTLEFSLQIPFTIPFTILNKKVLFPFIDKVYLLNSELKNISEMHLEDNILKENVKEDSNEIQLKIDYIGDLAYLKNFIVVFYKNNFIFYDLNAIPFFSISFKNVNKLNFFKFNDKLYAFGDKGYWEISLE